ncbi:hypothetical protein HZA57_08210 [Candidatus Poribacteria bacterium]|nr:hypothetical protein [Candidatus Poribacteria bacterium]
MPPIASRPIWFETFPELVLRWFTEQPAPLRETIGGAAEASLRAERRAQRVLEYIHFQPMRLIKTAREWETRWDPEAAWSRLEAVVHHFGWDVIRHRGSASDTEMTAEALREGERPSILIADRALNEQGAAAAAGGLQLPLTERDLAAIALAREVYSLVSEKMGKPPAPWVDELAPHEFTRVALGLPFSPLVWEFL